MYRALLSDYETRQTSLMMENSELKTVLQHMKKDMISILSPKKPCVTTEPTYDSLEQVRSLLAHSVNNDMLLKHQTVSI